MQPTRPLWHTQADLMAADTANLAAALAMHVHLTIAPFTPSLDSLLTDFVEATFTGYAAALLGTGAQIVYYDVATGLLTILIKSPAGGLHWVCTADPSPSQTIYGCYVTDNADAVLLGCRPLTIPVTISNAGQGLDMADLTLQFRLDSPA